MGTQMQAIGAALILILLVLGCGTSSPSKPTDTTPGKVRSRAVFIGNSLTLSNNLPAIIQALAASVGAKPFTYTMVAYGGFSLEDHWVRQQSHQAIAEKQWDVVILQQGMSGSAEGRALLLEYARRYAEEIYGAGAVPALYAVWPPRNAPDYNAYFDAISESYRHAATETGGMLFPVGEAWREALRRDSTIELYSPDNLHPTLLGSYLAALVMFEQLYNRSPIGLPSSIAMQPPLADTIHIPPATAAILQQAAAEANRNQAQR